ncbi:MAG: hypothetical protein GC137_08460, partial [Alphaproteobacteria bacterium]|nr:hypothetical protein [Alphaproteobacteria bacterium]
MLSSVSSILLSMNSQASGVVTGIVSKREEMVSVYHVSWPTDLSHTVIVEKERSLPFTMVVAGDISPDGSEILLKTYSAIFCYERTDNDEMLIPIDREYRILPY